MYGKKEKTTEVKNKESLYESCIFYGALFKEGL